MRRTDDWACDLDLWPWNRCATSHVSWSTLLPIWVIGYYDYSFPIYGLLGVACVDRLSVGGARRGVIAIDRPACCCLDGRNRQITVFRRQNSRFRKRFSKIGLSCNHSCCGHSLKYCVRIWCKLIRKWPRNTPKNNNQRYAVSSDWKICHRMCVSINGPGDLDLWPFDLETNTLVASKVRSLHSEFGHARPSGSPVIRYVRDGRTDGRLDGRTKAKLTAPRAPTLWTGA